MRKLLFIALLLCLPAFGQVTVSPFVTPSQQFLDNSGKPLSSGKICFFAAGSTTPQTAYSDNLGTVPLSNPALTDSAGRLTIFLAAQSYKIVTALSTANSQCSPALSTADGVTWATMANTVTSLVDTGALTVQASAAATSGANQSSPLLCVQGNYWTGAASASDKWCLQDLLGTGSNPTTTLNVTHGAGSSGTAGISFPMLTVTGASTLSSVNLIQFPTTGADCGFQAAYTALPSSGGTIILGADCTISSAQTLTLVAGKPLFIDLGGRKISMSQAAGVGLTIIKPDTTPRDPFGLSNGVFIYTGASNSVTGVQIGNGANPATDVSLVNVAIDNFSTTGSVGLNLTNVQDSRLEAVGFNGNATGLSVNLNSVQIQYDNVHFQGNSLAIVATDAYEQTFHDCLIQSSTGTKPVQIIASTINVINWRFKHCHFENNGDTTANTRQISFQPGVGKSISQVFLESNVFNSGANVNAGSFIYELTGAGTFSFLSLKHNRYFTSTNQFTGIGANTVTTEGENSQSADVSISGSAVANADGAGSGLVLAPIGSARKFQIYAGYPTQFDGSLIVKDLTANANILRYTSGLFDFQTNTVKGNTLQSVVATGTAPLVIASTTPVANLSINGGGTVDGDVIGGVTPAAGTFTTLQAGTYERTGVSNSRVFVGTSDFTTANNTNLQAITGLSWTFPTTAGVYSFHCAVLYSQATAAVADQFGIQAVTNAPTNINVQGTVYTNLVGALAAGNLLNLTTTTATAFVGGWTPSAINTVFNATFDGTIELGASANTVNLMVQTSNGADAITIKRGSYCNLF